MTDDLLLVGAGPMAMAYATVLQAMRVPFHVVGRSERACRAFEQTTGVDAAPGGIEDHSITATRAIVAVGAEALAAVTVHLLGAGVHDVLVEKPGGLCRDELERVSEAAGLNQARVLVGYNRRYYASVRRARRLLADDGGPRSIDFEFTEWADRVDASPALPTVKQRWFLANSSHVVDLAFFLGGRPVELVSQTAGGLPWHPAASVFAGCGRTELGALFSYRANWGAPGRWGVEITTDRRRLVLRPLEELRCRSTGSGDEEAVELDDDLDRRFKPGLYRQVEDFLSGGPTVLPTIDDQVRAVREIYDPMVVPAGSARPATR